MFCPTLITFFVCYFNLTQFLNLNGIVVPPPPFKNILSSMDLRNWALSAHDFHRIEAHVLGSMKTKTRNRVRPKSEIIIRMSDEIDFTIEAAILPLDVISKTGQ